MNTLVYFFNALKAALDHQGLTQLQLAENAGLKSSAISRLKKGTRSPGVDTLDKIADTLGYELVDLLVLGKEIEQGASPVLADSVYTPEWLKAFAHRVDGLSKPQRLKLLSMIEGFLQAHDK
jgi:Predicted transcriptional regulators